MSRQSRANPDLANLMRDRQARGKGQHGHAACDSSSSEDEAEVMTDEVDAGGRPKLRRPVAGMLFEERSRVEHAEAVLCSPERLWMYALAEDETVAQTKHRFMKKLLNIRDEPKPNRHHTHAWRDPQHASPSSPTQYRRKAEKRAWRGPEGYQNDGGNGGVEGSASTTPVFNTGWNN